MGYYNLRFGMEEKKIEFFQIFYGKEMSLSVGWMKKEGQRFEKTNCVCIDGESE